ncbi:anti-sigma factor [Arthrobacter burdickii]|uniref:Regulator of SigK n=1 Tax=Arthrobacter burdickii TaxID=3035920 RepID=A0ABT8K2F2_9MICC|nr:anti-sigma factor [Arthrobacter burdickii]MDN4611011.1 anti-sigma factor [Arthrobacter burdickii]
MNRQFADDLETDLARGHVLEWAELYALDAISADERRVLEAFLEDVDPAISATFADRVRTDRETITSAYAVDQIEPPADLFERIVAQLPAIAYSDAGPSQPLRPQSPGTAGPAGPPAEVAGQDELAQRRSAKASLSSRAGRWIVAAAAAAVIAMGGVTIAQNLQQTTVEQEVLQASDVRTQQLTLAAGGVADLAVSGEKNAAVVTLSGVPAPAEGHVYQMWRIPADGTAPVSEGTMSGEDVAGTKVTELTDISGYTAIAITVEPEGGSAAPTLPIVAQIPLGA